jgi:hypothetical protein
LTGGVTSLDAAAVRRFSRQIALPEVGPDGQARLAAAEVAVAGDDLAAETAATYLRAAGVGKLRIIRAGGAADGAAAGAGADAAGAGAAASTPWPGDGAAWVAALDGVALVVRSGFDDDAMLGAAKRLGIPAVVVRARRDGVDLVSFPRLPPAADAPLDAARGGAQRQPDGAASIAAGTLAAAEALQALLRPAGQTGARLLRLPLDGRAPQGQEIPWR